MTRTEPVTGPLALAAACAVIAIASASAVCSVSAGPVRQIAGLMLISTFTGAVWLAHRMRFEAIVPAVGLTLATLILAGLGLAAAHALTSVPVALVLASLTLATLWVGTCSHFPKHAEARARFEPSPRPVIAGVAVFAVVALLAVRYSAASAAAGSDEASSVAVWAYPSGDQLRVGLSQPAGHGPASLRIVVTESGVTVARWDGIHLSRGQQWEAPPLTLTGNGPAEVLVLDGARVVARLPSR